MVRNRDPRGLAYLEIELLLERLPGEGKGPVFFPFLISFSLLMVFPIGWAQMEGMCFSKF